MALTEDLCPSPCPPGLRAPELELAIGPPEKKVVYSFNSTNQNV